MNSTFDIRMVRGQTFKFTGTVRDANGQAVDLTDGKVYMAITADIKVAPSVKLTSEDPAPEGWRTGFVIADPQTGSTKGQFTGTIIGADTSALVALGDTDPYLYDVWAVIDTDDGTVTIPVITTSRLALYPQVTTIP